MKKVLCLLAVMLFSMNSFATSIKIGEWVCSYYKRNFDVFINVDKENKLSDVEIHCYNDKSNKEVEMIVEYNYLEAWCSCLMECKEKFDEWGRITDRQNVKDMTKKINNMPYSSVGWKVGNYYCLSSYMLPTCNYRVARGTKTVVISDKVKDWQNPLFDVRYYMIFKTTEEIDILRDLITPENVMEKYRQYMDSYNKLK